MNTSKIVKVRIWNNDANEFYYQDMTIEAIIRNPFRIHINDIGTALLDELRKDRGLELLPKNSIKEEVMK